MEKSYETKISDSLNAFSLLLLRPLPDFSLATWDLVPLSQHCIKDMLPMKIYPYLSDRREINETDVKYVETWNLQKVWDGSDSLKGNSCLLFNLYLIYNSNDQRRFLNTMECDHRGRGEGKWGEQGTILSYSYFWIEVFHKEVLGLLAYEGTTFMFNLSSQG